jgi:hypothetical protein
MPDPVSIVPAPTVTVTAPSSIAGPGYNAPQFDVLDALPPLASERLQKLRQRALDSHAVIPMFDQIQEASLARVTAQRALSRLVDHPQDHGFGLKSDNRSVIEAQRTLDKANADFERLKQLQEVRTAQWQSASGGLANTETYLRDGRPQGVVLEDYEGPEPTLAKGEDIFSALDKVRRRGRELRADLARIAAAPYPSSHARAKIRHEIEALAMQGAPVISDVIEHDRKIIWPMARLKSEVFAEQRALAFTEAVDPLALFAWLHKDALIKRLDAEIDSEADDAAALSHADRELRTAEVMGDILEQDRLEAALVWRAQDERLPIEHRADISPIALLGLRLVTVTNGHETGPSSWQHAYNIVGVR